ncbi:MAG: hypothetical protein IKR09_04010 [Alphaproteobacteria bacterium]|nr:hypothetical protein [Alphaproteobacteria bacterium]
MVNTLTLLSLLKPTFSFVFDLKRLVFLIAFSWPVLAVVLLASYFYPPLSLAETVQIRFDVNFYMIFLLAGSFSYLLTSVMLRTQQIVFFGDDPERRIFFPKPDKRFGRYIAAGIRILLCSSVLSGVFVFLLMTLIQHFLSLPVQTWLVFLAGTVLFCPYFVVRFIFKLPAVAAGQPLSWWDAWRMSSRINIAVAVLFAFFMFVPMSAVIVFYSGMQAVVGKEFAEMFAGSFGVAFSLLISVILQAAYCAYLYSYISSKS